ncbi:MAG: hypothetical protein ACRETM_11875 [Stenotrophobium sp.]
MCGLVGAIVQNNVTPILIEALERLEDGDYVSAGVAVVNRQRRMRINRQVGEVGELRRSFDGAVVVGNSLGIGYARWATHGELAEHNVPPHVSCNEIAVVHNGAIENHETLKRDLEGKGYRFRSDTDTEVIAHLIHLYLTPSHSLLDAVCVAVQKLEGAFAVAVLAVSEPETLVVARSGSPLVIGVGESEQYVASDVAALLPVTRRLIFMEDGDVAELKPGNISIVDDSGQVAVRPLRDLR